MSAGGRFFPFISLYRGHGFSCIRLPDTEGKAPCAGSVGERGRANRPAAGGAGEGERLLVLFFALVLVLVLVLMLVLLLLLLVLMVVVVMVVAVLGGGRLLREHCKRGRRDRVHAHLQRGLLFTCKMENTV